ncbi:MAG TPA: hypothetical protein VHC97_24605 [Thermoanaerobaculia bacterium]|nr:hypothetical protein [Thermoanaerobaculia bacterium]
MALARYRGMLPRYVKAPNPPCKEKLPEIRSLARHPWEITVREFVEKVRRDYGIELSVTYVTLTASLYLRKNDRLYLLLVADEDDILPLDVLRSLCRAFDVPPADFHLDPDPDD